MGNNNTSLKSTMNLGLILGVILMILHLLFWLVNHDGVKYSALINYTAIAICIFKGTKSFRDEERGGIMSYGQALRFGANTGFFSSVVYALFFYVFITVIDPEFIERARLLTEESMYNLGSTEEDIDLIMSIKEVFQNPVLWAISEIITFSFIGFVVSLITSIFVKNEGDPFNTNRSEIK